MWTAWPTLSNSGIQPQRFLSGSKFLRKYWWYLSSPVAAYNSAAAQQRAVVAAPPEVVPPEAAEELGLSGTVTDESAWQDEAPTWAPNGRIVQFFRTARNSGESSIWQVDLTGRNERRLPTPVGASDPAWGPVLP